METNGEYQTTNNKEARRLNSMGFLCKKEYLGDGRYTYIFEDSVALETVRREDLYGDS